MAEGVVVIEPGDDRAKKIARAMASQTASDVLGVLRKGEHTSSEIAEALALPITTVAYHIDNLTEAGMIEVMKTRWSSKGREVKVYGVADQLVIMAPSTTDVRSLLLKYASLFSILVFASLMIIALSPLLATGSQETLGYAPTAEEMDGVMKIASAGERSNGGGIPDIAAEYAFVLAFFSGGCVILLLLIAYELIWWYRDTRPRERA
jgi:DNA-binding transcriptional ArsR family regulator